MTDETAAAGWYPQPDGKQRYWDGRQWTGHVEPGADQPERGPAPRRGRGCLIAVLVAAVLFVLLIVFWVVQYQRGEKAAGMAEEGATTACGTPATAPGFDVKLGTPYLLDGKDLVPVSVTNNTDSTHDVIVVLRQYNLEGCQQLDGRIAAQMDDVAPGQTGTDDAGEVSRLVPTLSLEGKAYQVELVNVLPAKGSPFTTFDPD